MDINSVNSDLIAVGYGEYDIIVTEKKEAGQSTTEKLKNGILAFWTLKKFKIRWKDL